MSEAAVVVQSLSHVQLFVTSWTVAWQAPLSSTISHGLLKFMSIEPVMPSNHLILCGPLLPLRPPSSSAFNFPSIRVFSNKLAFHIRWLQHQSFQWIFMLISFRIDCFDLLAVQRTLESLLQHHNLKASIILCSAFFMVQLSHQYIFDNKGINEFKQFIWFSQLKLSFLFFKFPCFS